MPLVVTVVLLIFLVLLFACVRVCVCVCVCVCGSVGKESACNAGDPGFMQRSSGEGSAAHSSILAWEIQWTEELGRLQST